VIASIFGYFANSALSGIAGAFVKAADVFLQALFTAMTASTSLDLTSGNFVKEFDSVFALGLLVMLALALVEIAAGALQRNGARVAKVPLNMVLMIVGTMATIAIVDMLLAATDSMAAGLLSLSGVTLSGTSMTVSLAALASDPAVAIFVATLVLLAVFAIFVTLVVREVLIVMTVVMAPIALAGFTSQTTRSWVRRWIEMTLALIFSKVILVIILVTGFNLLAGIGSSSGAAGVASSVTSLLGGVGLLMLASFSPMVAMKMVHFTGGHFEEAARMGHASLSSAMAPEMVKDTARKASGAVGGVVPAPAGASATTGAAKAENSRSSAATESHPGEVERVDAKSPRTAGSKESESTTTSSAPSPRENDGTGTGPHATSTLAEARRDAPSQVSSTSPSTSNRVSSESSQNGSLNHELGAHPPASPNKPASPSSPMTPPLDRPSAPTALPEERSFAPRPLPPMPPESGVADVE
jgi:type IV secretion system protein TrbL